jgi:hypothetical protein
VSNVVNLADYRAAKIASSTPRVYDPLFTEKSVPILVIFRLQEEGTINENRARHSLWVCARSFDEARKMTEEQYGEISGFTLLIEEVMHASDALNKRE